MPPPPQRNAMDLKTFDIPTLTLIITAIGVVAAIVAAAMVVVSHRKKPRAWSPEKPPGRWPRPSWPPSPPNGRPPEKQAPPRRTRRTKINASRS
uniref:Uncharacterized protein n=1 Tax=Candidatus Kentrum eta TaxID=2126337 RepID=A0A450U5B6_9GAMM|nr:MAG: hypothetical protein BECKH772A_GA0070896_1000114 [Candidatus Kentron sp. H]VFJ88163.1 MAG: hypothetical protein BECKH772B_GA0070898_100015 [Candidatus Kentron sp. H]VFJ95388.1 MAG: hypothetical protein BECKH772C_GA0070978_1000214 [Candidatus Kentron sp. H]